MLLLEPVSVRKSHEWVLAQQHYIAILQSPNAPYELKTNTYTPQIDAAKGTIAVPIEAEGVYPLMIASGPDAQSFSGLVLAAGHPALLTSEPGTEVYYSLADR